MLHSFENVTAFKSMNEKLDYRFTGNVCVMGGKFRSFMLVACSRLLCWLYSLENRICTCGEVTPETLFFVQF